MMTRVLAHWIALDYWIPLDYWISMMDSFWDYIINSCEINAHLQFYQSPFISDAKMDNNITTKNGQQLTVCADEQQLIENILFQIIFSLFYIIIFVLGILGNFLVTYVVCKNRRMQNPTNLFITNLACSDILMCCLSVPFTPIQSFTGKWLFGDVLCTLFPVTQGFSIYVSTMTMTIIALDRFVVVCFPYRQRMQVSITKLMSKL